jgi:hypothetical protein
MPGELGRISGPLLAANLLRQGVDLAFETNLLYLDVVNGRIGIKTDTPSRTLTVNGTASTLELIVDTQADIAQLSFVDNIIQNPTGSIVIRPNQATAPEITANEIQTSKLKLSNSAISTLALNDNIELTANGTGRVVFTTAKVKVNGNLHATGDITWDGNIALGNDSSDNVSFGSDINSSIIPNVNDSFTLGDPSKYWRTLYTENLISDTVTTTALAVPSGIDLLLRPGNTIYVSVNGNDANYGDHQSSTFRTIKHALSVATVGDSILIFPGTYQEIFPLTVPAGVNVSGTDIRSVTISPTVGTVTNDAFLLNGESTVSNLTISGMKYTSLTNTGYAFRFANNFKVTTRSPYIQNISVINTSPNAGRGALVDGSVANSTSVQASMLFHAVTFIIPGADGITATNGARVEWLNSFSYYANRGIYLTRGSLGFASQGVVFGAEFRSIGSANVYGTFGAVADGAGTLAYLVGHNFGYIGSGLNNQNDDQLTLQANEVVELNTGRIYYDSMDHKGNFRIGDIFLVDQQTGNVTFNAQSIDFGAGGNITLTGPGSETIIDATRVQTGNIRIYDNNIDSLVGPVNIFAQSGTSTFNTTVNVAGSVEISGNTVVAGNVFLGDDPLDLVSIIPRLTQNINPSVTNTYSLGQKLPTEKIWDVGFLTTINVDGVTELTGNTISTLTTNTDLRLVAAGTGNIQVTSTDVLANNSLTVGNTLTVNADTSLKATTVVGDILLTGNIGQTGNTSIIGLFSNNNIDLTGTSSSITVPSIQIQNNNINATATNANLQLTGLGTAGVVFDNRIQIVDSVISNVWSSATTDSQRSIIFSPNGTGNVVINSTNFLQIPYSNNTTKILSNSGEIRQNLTTGDYEGYLNTGNESFTNVYSSNKLTYITPELTIGANDNILRFVTNGVVRATINSTQLTAGTLQAGNLSFSTNTINNVSLNSDTLLESTGTGSVNLNNIPIKDNTFTNLTNSAISINSTGRGYVKFAGTGAVVLAIGDTGERRATPELGEIRYNTEINYMEVYSGDINQGDDGWIPAVGTSGAAGLSDVLEIMDIYSLILG